MTNFSILQFDFILQFLIIVQIGSQVADSDYKTFHKAFKDLQTHNQRDQDYQLRNQEKYAKEQRNLMQNQTFMQINKIKRRLNRLVSMRKGDFKSIKSPRGDGDRQQYENCESRKKSEAEVYRLSMQAIYQQNEVKGLTKPITFKDKYLVYFNHYSKEQKVNPYKEQNNQDDGERRVLSEKKRGSSITHTSDQYSSTVKHNSSIQTVSDPSPKQVQQKKLILEPKGIIKPDGTKIGEYSTSMLQHRTRKPVMTQSKVSNSLKQSVRAKNDSSFPLSPSNDVKKILYSSKEGPLTRNAPIFRSSTVLKEEPPVLNDYACNPRHRVTHYSNLKRTAFDSWAFKSNHEDFRLLKNIVDNRLPQQQYGFLQQQNRGRNSQFTQSYTQFSNRDYLDKQFRTLDEMDRSFNEQYGQLQNRSVDQYLPESPKILPAIKMHLRRNRIYKTGKCS